METKETTSGQNELFDKEDDDADVDMAELGSDVEKLDAETHSTEEEEEDTRSSVGEDAELAEFDAKLAQAFQTRRADEDLAISGEESSDEDMNDEQMAALDAHIESMFRERKKASGQKKENKDAKETIILFKCRVVELLEIYVKQQHQNPDALTLIVPLLMVIKTTSSKEVSEKSCNLIREFAKLFRFRPEENSIDSDVLQTSRLLLDEVHDLAGMEGSNVYRNACSQASLLLVKLVLQNGGTVEEVWQRYAKTGISLMTDSACKIKNSFFVDWLNWCTSAREKLVQS